MKYTAQGQIIRQTDNILEHATKCMHIKGPPLEEQQLDHPVTPGYCR